MGKSTVAEILAQRGMAVVDTDELARLVVRPGEPALEEIRDAFGSAVFHPTGELNREALADVVFRGVSTQHVRAGFGDEVGVDELRQYWAPISPVPFIPRVSKMERRPIRFLCARYDLTFPIDLSLEAIATAKEHNLPIDVVWFSCGHYTLASMPWKAIDAWKIATFMRKHL